MVLLRLAAQNLTNWRILFKYYSIAMLSITFFELVRSHLFTILMIESSRKETLLSWIFFSNNKIISSSTTPWLYIRLSISIIHIFFTHLLIDKRPNNSLERIFTFTHYVFLLFVLENSLLFLNSSILFASFITLISCVILQILKYYYATTNDITQLCLYYIVLTSPILMTAFDTIISFRTHAYIFY